MWVSACGGQSAHSLMVAGQEQLDKRDVKTAVISLKSALQADPKLVEARTLLGRALLESGDPGGAVLELTKALELSADSNRALPLLAKALLLRGEHKRLVTQFGDRNLTDAASQAVFKAQLATAWAYQGDRARTEAAINDALKAQPDAPAARLLQVRLLAGDGKFDSALAQINALVASHPSMAEAWHLQGELLALQQTDHKAAIEAFQKALTLDKLFVPAHVALVNAHIRGNDLDAARRQTDTLKELLPQHPQAVLADAQLAYAGRDFKKARESTQMLVRGAPNNTSVLVLAGAVEAQAGSPLQAQAHFAKALQLDPNLRLARVNLARTHLRLGQPARSLEVIQPLVGAQGHDVEAMAVAGDAALQLGDPRAAEGFFTRAAKANPTDERVRTALALTQLSRGDSTQAFAQLEALQSQSKDTYVDMALVSERLKRNELDAALAAVDRMVKKGPEVAATHELRGRVLLARKDHAGARAALERALSIDPTMFAAVSNLASIDLLEKKPEEAVKRMRAAIQADPRNHYAHMGLAELRARQGAPLEEIRPILQGAIKAAPTESAPRVAMIDLLQRHRQNKEALTAAQEAAAAMPNDSDVLDALGRVQASGGDNQQAISTFRRITGIDSHTARPHVRLADVLRANGQNTAAVASLRRALEIEPDLEIARARLIEVLVSEGRTKDALDIARDFQKRASKSAVGYLLEAGVHKRARNNDASVLALKQGLQHASDKSELALQYYKSLLGSKQDAEADRFALQWVKEHPEDAGMHYQLGVTLVTRGQLADAERWLQTAVKLRPHHILALNNLAWVLAMQDKPGAVAVAQRAADLAPKQPAIVDTLATALASEKQYAKALEASRQAVEMAPGDMPMRLNLAKIALLAGDKAAAKAELDRLAGLGARFPYQAEVDKLRQQL